MVHVGNARRVPRVGGRGILERFAEIYARVDLLAGFLVESMQRRVGCAHGAPVGHHPTRIAPLLLEHVIEQDFARARGLGVDPVIRAHHGARPASFDRDTEREQIAFATRRLGNVNVVEMAAGLLVVEGKVLDRGDHVDRLNPGDRRAGKRACEPRILAQVFEGAAVARFANEVHAARQEHIETLCSRLAADHRAALLQQRGIPGRGERHAGRQCGRAVLAQPHDVRHAERGVRFRERRNAETRDARHVAGPWYRLRRRLEVAEGNCHGTMHEGVSLGRRQGLYDVCRPRIRVGRGRLSRRVPGRDDDTNQGRQEACLHRMLSRCGFGAFAYRRRSMLASRRAHKAIAKFESVSSKTRSRARCTMHDGAPRGVSRRSRGFASVSRNTSRLTKTGSPLITSRTIKRRARSSCG